MSAQKDLQDLLRLLTGARKVPMRDAIKQAQALQTANLRSIKDIAEAGLPSVEAALPDAKAARALQNACKAALKRGDLSASISTRKHSTPSTSGPDPKRAKFAPNDPFAVGPTVDLTPQQLEASLSLPIALPVGASATGSADGDVEARIARTVLLTNRAPLVLAFAVELLRYTMPEQPLSSRLSLAQAVVSANSRSKAVSLGIEKGAAAEEEGWADGQPKVVVMGRRVAVLKRGGYEWKGEEVDALEGSAEVKSETQMQGQTQKEGIQSQTQTQDVEAWPSMSQQSRTEPVTSQQHTTIPSAPAVNKWSASRPISLKESTFIARATTLTQASERQPLIQNLMDTHPNLKTATHNTWAYRTRALPGAHSMFLHEKSFDDGETGAGDLLLKVMREANAVDTLIVLTRWWGGIMLGPDRWRLMRNCAQGALAERLRLSGTEVELGGEAVWGLDLEGMKNKSQRGGSSRSFETTVVGMQIHRPEAARSYLLKSFATASPEEGGVALEADVKVETKTTPKKKTLKAVDAEKEENLGLLLGAIRLVYDSWADHLDAAELDRRAWKWYERVRPEVQSGPSGWGAKGTLKLKDILELRRKG